MRISTTTHYASRLLLDLAQNAGQAPVPASKLAANTGIPVKFVEKIVRPLKAAGFVKSVRGAARVAKEHLAADGIQAGV